VSLSDAHVRVPLFLGSPWMQLDRIMQLATPEDPRTPSQMIAELELIVETLEGTSSILTVDQRLDIAAALHAAIRRMEHKGLLFPTSLQLKAASVMNDRPAHKK
jgi:hypothetical protein